MTKYSLPILAVISFTTLLYMFIYDGCIERNKYKYRIVSTTKAYLTNKYDTINNSCVTFVSEDSVRVVICGSFSITENK